MRTMQDKLEIGDLSNMTTYQAGALQASANRALRLFCNEVLRPYGITKKQWMVIGLALQAGAGGANCAEITRRLDMTPQSLNSMLTTLGKRKKTSQQNLSERPKDNYRTPRIRPGLHRN